MSDAVSGGSKQWRSNESVSWASGQHVAGAPGGHGGPAQDESPPPPHLPNGLTWKNKLKCWAILDAHEVNEGDPRPPSQVPSAGSGGDTPMDGAGD